MTIAANLPVAFAALLAGGLLVEKGTAAARAAFAGGPTTAASAAVAPATGAGGALSPAQVAAIAVAHGAPADVAQWLGDTSVPESGGHPGEVNSSSKAAGLLQILPSAWPTLAAAGDLLDPDYNIRAALYVLSVQGSSAWSGSGTWRGPPVPPGRYHFPHP